MTSLLPNTNHVSVAMTERQEKMSDCMPHHLRHWFRFAQLLPTILMGLLTIAVLFHRSSVGTMAYLNRLGISNLEFGSACLVSTIYLAVATRQWSWPAVIHFLLGTLPILFFTGTTIILALSGDLPWTALAVYTFTYITLIALYWLAIGLAEWHSNVAHRGVNDD